MRKILWSLAAIVMLVAACSGATTGSPTTVTVPAASPESKTPSAEDVVIIGNPGFPVNKLAIQAIADLEKYWAEEFPNLYGRPYKPVEGGLFAVMPSTGVVPPCAVDMSAVAGNAFYCALEDVVAWDAEGMFPVMQTYFGDFAVQVVMAHEWGHVIQARSNFFGETVTRELQADCFAGAWAKHAQKSGVFDVSAADLDEAAAGVLSLRDALGTSPEDPSAHGSGFDRVGAFQDGYDYGPARCKAYRDGQPIVVELPFNDEDDQARGGNAAYDSIVNGIPHDLEDYWTHVFPELAGKPWTPLRGLEPFAPGKAPPCGGEPVDGYLLFYCRPADYIAWENMEAMPKIYERGGDFAVGALLATQYGLAALARMDDRSDEKTRTLRADCFAGGYTASVLLGNRAATSSARVSPGDLDEAIIALLVFRGEGDVERQGVGFERVRAYREGVIKGAKACTTLQ